MIPEDVKALAISVLAHRVLIKPEAQLRGLSSSSLVERVLASIPVPRLAESP